MTTSTNKHQGKQMKRFFDAVSKSPLGLLAFAAICFLVLDLVMRLLGIPQ